MRKKTAIQKGNEENKKTPTLKTFKKNLKNTKKCLTKSDKKC